MSEKDFDKGYKSGFKFGKEVANEEWQNKIKQAREEIAKVYPESIFDHDKALRTTLQIIDELIAESED